MNKIVYTFLFHVVEVILELHLRKPGFTCNTSGLFTKHHKKVQNLETQVI